jgi:hypothetical protein
LSVASEKSETGEKWMETKAKSMEGTLMHYSSTIIDMGIVKEDKSRNERKKIFLKPFTQK